MDLIEIIVLSIVQGISEFLPISSSGHVVVVAALLEAITKKPLPDVLEVNIVLHFGTLLAVIAFYWKRLWRLFGEDRHTIGLLVIGSLPIAVVGFAVHRWMPQMLESAWLSGWMLLVTATIVLWASRHLKGQLTYQQINYRQAFWVGLWQAVAVLPGVSRSGSTIAAGLAVGLRPEAAAAFSFMLAIPAIFGACLLHVSQLSRHGGASMPLSLLALGALLAFVVGLLALRWLLLWIQGGRLHYFAFWCAPLGVAVIAWQLTLVAQSPGETKIAVEPPPAVATEIAEFDEKGSGADEPPRGATSPAAVDADDIEEDVAESRLHAPAESRRWPSGGGRL